VKVVVPADAPTELLGPLPDGVELVREPSPDAELLVLGFEPPPPLEALPALRVIQTPSAGVEWLLPFVPEGITICNGSGIHDTPVAEWVVAMILALRRRLPEFCELQRRGRWEGDVNEGTATGPSPLGSIDDLERATVLVLGHGSIGRALEARLAPFGARTVGIARHARPGVEPLERVPELLPEADVVVLLLPLTAETEGLVDAAFLARMPDGALLVNAARGKLVDTGALERELRAGRLRAALDVTDPEPLPPDHSLWSAPGVLITPHVAGSVSALQARSYRFAGDQIRRYAAGEPLLNVRTDY